MAAPWDWDATLTQFVEPYHAMSDTNAGPFWARDSISSTSGTQTHFVKIYNNIIARTLPTATNVSDWGYGSIFTSYGYMDPAATDDIFIDLGIDIYAPIIALSIRGNTIFGMANPVSMNTAGIARAFLFSDITGNDFIDFNVGIVKNDVEAQSWDMTIESNNFVADPFWKASTRTVTDGSWTGVSNSQGLGLSLLALKGITLRNNTFADMSRIGRVGTTDYATWNIQGNVALGQLASVAFSTSNLGVGSGLTGLGLDQLSYHDTQTDETNASYGLVETPPPLTISSVTPPAGPFYIIGHVVRRSTAPTVGATDHIGWVRITEGRAAVLGTDWALIDVTIAAS